jgi:Zn finger protein HypA/HybF involved in hydrogenase expression
MHESGLAGSLLDAVLAAVPPSTTPAADGSAHVTVVEVHAGNVAVPSVEALAFHFGLAAAGTPAAGADLRVVRLPGEPAAFRLVAIDVEDGPPPPQASRA